MPTRKCRYFACDFETTVYKGQVATEVWAAANVELFTDNYTLYGSIEEQFNYFVSLKTNIIAYYHNLKFDGSFWISYLIKDLGYTQAYEKLNEEGTSVKWLKDKDMPNKSVKYLISEMGQWYYLKVKINNKIIEYRDSLKLLPFSIKRIGDSFGTKHKKLEMNYKGFRYPNCYISPDEQEYIKNDVYVLKEALEIMFNEGHSKLTIGSCCLTEYKTIVGKEYYNAIFPDVQKMPCTSVGRDWISNIDQWVRKSYRGGWCYIVKGKRAKLFTSGTTADVNSLYPSMMHSESGNKFPTGRPKYWKGNYIPDEAFQEDRYFFVRIKTRFSLKPGYLPFIQIKGNPLYKGTESLITSDVWDSRQQKYVQYTRDKAGNIYDTRVDLTLTQTDYQLIKEHYDLYDFEIIEGYMFRAMVGIFDEYIDKYKEIKMNNKGAIRELAKLFLNNLYGKFATNVTSTFKVAYVRDDKSIGYFAVFEEDKDAGYIPVGSAITSYARNFTIRAAQKNYYGDDKPGFIYADTDSIHCDLAPEQITGITVHPTNFCCWKLESCWDAGWFVRQKTYIEHVFMENMKPIEEPYYNIKCAGMPEKCKKLFLRSMLGYKEEEGDEEKYTEEEIEWMKQKRNLEDFNVGLVVPGKLIPRTILGGVLLVDTPYEMRRI